MTFLCSWRRPKSVVNIKNVIVHLENDALKITEWFPNNCMKLNGDKCHLIIFGAKGSNETTIKIGRPV